MLQCQKTALQEHSKENSVVADLEHPCLHRNGVYESIHYYSYIVKGKLLKLFSIKRLLDQTFAGSPKVGDSNSVYNKVHYLRRYTVVTTTGRCKCSNNYIFTFSLLGHLRHSIVSLLDKFTVYTHNKVCNYLVVTINEAYIWYS